MHSEMPWDVYPRPQLKRDSFCNLNGIWKLNGEDIVVPYPPQSNLSGYKKEVTNDLVYEKSFYLPEEFDKKRVLLHFGAVDQSVTVWLNDRRIGRHEGGYLPFYFDISSEVDRSGKNRLKVVAIDSLDKNYPYGKQTKKPGGMWYTPVSGIWKTVWLENVPNEYVTSVKLDVDLESVCIKINGNYAIEGFKVILDGEEQVFEGDSARIKISAPVHWTPENPHLYSMIIETKEDRVETYFALRTIDIREVKGVKRVCLNGKPVLFHGVLDQGYFPEGIYTPKYAQEYDEDILKMKELGFNMLRKHIKVEPEYFYYACDKIGIFVMQDMVNTGGYSFVRDTALPTIGFKRRNDNVKLLTKAMNNFKSHTQETIMELYNHPSIVAYTIFNEGWGQFNSDEMYDYVKEMDSSRLIDSTSGWFAQKKNDFDSQHIYFKIKNLVVKDRPLFVTECGGYKLFDKEHFYGRKEYGYGTCEDVESLTSRVEEMYDKMIIPGIKSGVCGCIYTQLSDVEDEINGLYTYDRQVCKVDKEKMKNIAKRMEKELW